MRLSERFLIRCKASDAINICHPLDVETRSVYVLVISDMVQTPAIEVPLTIVTMKLVEEDTRSELSAIVDGPLSPNSIRFDIAGLPRNVYPHGLIWLLSGDDDIARSRIAMKHKPFMNFDESFVSSFKLKGKWKHRG